LRWLLPLLILLPFIDIALLIILARTLPRPWILLWVALACVAGGLLVVTSRAGLRGPATRVPDLGLAARQLLRLGAGMLLLFPGPLSDVLALLLIVPRSRRRIAGWLVTRALGFSISSLGKRTYTDPEPWAPAGDRRAAGRPGEQPFRDVEFEVLGDIEDPPSAPEGHEPGSSKPE
jgi:UPF0716 protein FxsA